MTQRENIRKKIIIIGPAFPYRGGIANFTDSLYTELVKDHDVSIITFKRQYPSFLFPGKTQFEEEGSSPGINARMLIDSINPLNWRAVGSKIRDEKPDLVIVKFWLPFFGLCFGSICKIIKQNKSTKIIAICHNVIPHERKPGDKLLAKYFFKYCDRFILLSRKVVDDLKSLVPDARYSVLFHPVYSKFGEKVNKTKAKFLLNINKQNVILFFGLIRDYKGLDTLLEALAIVKKKIDLGLIIAGEFYSNQEKYKSIINRLKLSDDIFLFDLFIPAEEVKNFFSASDAVILPYKDATQSGIVQVAMNFRKPVIAANVGGLGEVVVDGVTGYVVNKDDPAALAEAILKFYKENKEAEFVTHIEKEVDKYSWKSFVTGMLQFIKESSDKQA